MFGSFAHLGRLQLEALDEGAKRAESHCKVRLSFAENTEVVASVAGFCKEASQDQDTESTNHRRHDDQCDDQSTVSCSSSQVGDSQPEVCQHKLG